MAPTFNLGGQLGQDGIAPVVGSGFNIKVRSCASELYHVQGDHSKHLKTIR